MREAVTALRNVSKTLRRIADFPVPQLPTPSSNAVLTAYSKAYSRSLRNASQRCTRLADRIERQIKRAGRTGLRPEAQMSFSMQYLQLQEQMQRENREFTMISNIMKAKHEAVKNTIANIR